MLDVAGSMGWEVWGLLAAVVLPGALLISLVLRRRRARRARGREFEAYRAALEALLSDDLPAAASALRDAAVLNSSRVSTYLALGRIFRRLGDPERALRIHRTLLVRQEIASSLRLDALREAALDELSANRAQEALALIDEVLAKRRKDREALAAAVEAHARLGHWAAAYEIQRRIDRVTKTAHPALLARLLAAEARQRLAQNDPAAAKKALKKALGAHAESIDALLALGDAELLSGKSERAIESWEKILRIESGRTPALFARLEQAFFQLGDVERLEELLRRLITGRPNDANLQLLLGRHLAKKQRADDALGALKQAIDLDPANLAARRAWGQFRMEHGGEDSLETDYQSLLEALPVSSAESVSAPRPAAPLEAMLHQDESGAWARGPAEPPAR